VKQGNIQGKIKHLSETTFVRFYFISFAAQHSVCCISIVCDAQRYLCSYLYLFWHTNQCTFVLILILVHNNIYVHTLIDSSTQLGVQLYSYRFCCTTPFTLLLKLILVHNFVYSCIHINSEA